MGLNTRCGTGIKDDICKSSQFQVQLWLFNLVLKLLSHRFDELRKLFDVGFIQDLLRQVTLPFDLFFQRFRHIRYYIGQHELCEINNVLRGEQNGTFRTLNVQTLHVKENESLFHEVFIRRITSSHLPQPQS